MGPAPLVLYRARPRERGRYGPRIEAGVMIKRPLVAVVDDSESVRESLPDLLQQVGFAVQAFASAEAFLASEAVDETSCLILDVGLPGMSGPDLQQELIRRRQSHPDRLHHRARRQVAPPAPARRRGGGVPVQTIQRHRVARSGRSRACGRGKHDNRVSENVTRRPYTVSPSTAARRIEVVTMADVTGIVFVVDDDVSVRESLELLIKHAGWQPRHVRIRTGISRLPSCHRSELPRARRDAARAQRSRAAEAARRPDATCRSSSSPAMATCRCRCKR